jgi:putative hydrolase of the HAD superfamily
MTLEEETLALLEALEKAGIPYGIVTNGPSQQHLKIQQLGLKHRVRCLFVSAEFGCNKPDPAIFRAAAACLEVPCEQVLFVGDNPEADISGAKSVGMKTAWLSRGTAWPASLSTIQPDYSLQSLSELSAVLNLLECP